MQIKSRIARVNCKYIEIQFQNCVNLLFFFFIYFQFHVQTQLFALLFHRVFAHLTSTGQCNIVESHVDSVQVHEAALLC